MSISMFQVKVTTWTRANVEGCGFLGRKTISLPFTFGSDRQDTSIFHLNLFEHAEYKSNQLRSFLILPTASYERAGALNEAGPSGPDMGRHDKRSGKPHVA